MKTGFLLILTIFSGSSQPDEGATAVFETRERCERVGQMAIEHALNELSQRGIKAGSAWYRCQEVRGRAMGDLMN